MKKKINSLDGLSNIKKHYWITSEGKVLSSSRGSLREMSQSINKKGYKQIGLMDNNGKQITLPIHRLVALAFCDEYSDEKNHVNHIDENKENNNYTNLEWCTPGYNKTYSAGMKIQMIVNNKVLKEYNSQSDASRDTGICQTNIGKVISGDREYAGAFSVSKNKIIKANKHCISDDIVKIFWRKK
ncbi:MAG: HNH endonuclease [Sarcina sp.]